MAAVLINGQIWRMMHVQGKMKYIFEYYSHKNDNRCLYIKVYGDDRIEWGG